MNSSEINQLFGKALTKERYHLLEEELVELIAGAGIKTSLESRVMSDGYLLRIKNTREFGMVIQAGVGGKNAEVYAQCFRKGQALVSSLTMMIDGKEFLELFKKTFAYINLKESVIGKTESNIDKILTTLFSNFIEIANQFSPDNTDTSYVIDELEIDPLFLIDGKIVATNCKCNFTESIQARAPRPVSNIERMLHPASIGIIGVSASKMNFGRIILKNVIASGYDKSKMVIIRPDEEEIDGVRCVDSLQSLDKKLDLFIVAIGADSVYSLVDEVIEANAAEGVMLIPGGLGETEASREPVARMVDRIEKAHRNNESAPVFIGGNCLGIVSHPGGYDTWFIPVEKLPKTQKKDLRNSAFVSQSGAFMITRLSKNPWIDPSYMIAVGNQNDLGHGDMLNYFADHEEIDVIGFYIEGFKNLDGLVFARAARRAVLKGKEIIVYKAGQTSAGEDATLGHTASISGDFTLCESILKQAGVMICSDFGDFSDLFYLAPLLHGKIFNGNRIGAVSGAGFETVGMADGLSINDYSMQMAQLDSTTIKRLEGILIAKRLDALMEVRNPLDINPGADDEAHLQCVEALAADPNVDAIVVGLDPLSPVTKTLEKSSRPGFDIYAEDSAVQQYPVLLASIDKPVIGIVEGGKMYDAMIENLMDQGVCIFRSCEQGMRALVKYTQARIRAEEIRNREKRT